MYNYVNVILNAWFSDQHVQKWLLYVLKLMAKKRFGHMGSITNYQ